MKRLLFYWNAVGRLHLGTKSLLVALWFGARTTGEGWGKFLEPSAVSEWVSLAKCVFLQRPGPGKPQRGRTGNGACNVLHTVLRTFSGTWMWGSLGTFQKHILWEFVVVYSFMWFSQITLHVQNQWKKALKLLNSPDCIMLLFSVNSQPNWILNRKQSHFSTQNKKTLSC